MIAYTAPHSLHSRLELRFPFQRADSSVSVPQSHSNLSCIYSYVSEASILDKWLHDYPSDISLVFILQLKANRTPSHRAACSAVSSIYATSVQTDLGRLDSTFSIRSRKPADETLIELRTPPVSLPLLR